VPFSSEHGKAQLAAWLVHAQSIAKLYADSINKSITTITEPTLLNTIARMVTPEDVLSQGENMRTTAQGEHQEAPPINGNFTCQIVIALHASNLKYTTTAILPPPYKEYIGLDLQPGDWCMFTGDIWHFGTRVLDTPPGWRMTVTSDRANVEYNMLPLLTIYYGMEE
jgi:hypothetical protein